MKKEQLQRKLDKIRREQEFFKKINLVEQPGLSGGKISLEDQEITINYDPEFQERINDNGTRKYLNKKNIMTDKVLETLVTDLLYHEIGHRGSRKYPGCPGDVKTLSQKFLDPIYEVTKIDNKQKLAHLANSITDTIDNTIIKHLDNEEGVTGLSGFYLFLKENGILSKGKFSKLYEAHVRLILYFNGDQIDKELLKPYLSNDPEVNKAIQNFLHRTGVSELKMTTYQGSKEIQVRDRQETRKYLMDETNWENISKIYAEEFGKFIEEPPEESLFGSGGGIGDSPSDKNDGESSSNPKGGIGESSDQDDENDLAKNLIDLIEKELANQFQEDDGFGRELKEKGKLRQIIRGRTAGSDPGWMTNFEYLVQYYEMLASDKLFEFRTPPTKGKSYPLIDIGQRTFDFENDIPRDIRGMVFDPDTKGMELYVARHLHDVNVRVKKTRTDTPDIVFGLLDTSSSMLERMPKGPGLREVVNPKGLPQWNVNSKYHVSLIAYFMMVERFSELGIYDSDAYFANFSYSTVLSRGLMNSKIEALCPQFGGTSINMQKIEQILSKKGTLIFTLSDGEIENSNKVLNKFKDVSQYNPCFHVQIGKHSDFSKGLKRAGVYVKLVKEEKDLYDFVIDLTEKVYDN